MFLFDWLVDLSVGEFCLCVWFDCCVLVLFVALMVFDFRFVLTVYTLIGFWLFDFELCCFGWFIWSQTGLLFWVCCLIFLGYLICWLWLFGLILLCLRFGWVESFGFLVLTLFDFSFWCFYLCLLLLIIWWVTSWFVCFLFETSFYYSCYSLGVLFCLTRLSLLFDTCLLCVVCLCWFGYLLGLFCLVLWLLCFVWLFMLVCFDTVEY